MIKIWRFWTKTTKLKYFTIFWSQSASQRNNINTDKQIFHAKNHHISKISKHFPSFFYKPYTAVKCVWKLWCLILECMIKAEVQPQAIACCWLLSFFGEYIRFFMKFLHADMEYQISQSFYLIHYSFIN